MNKQTRQRLRAAVAIYDKLCLHTEKKAPSSFQPSVLNRFTAASKPYDLASQRSWRTAQRLSQVRLSSAIDRLCEELHDFRATLSQKQKRLPELRELLADLMALEEEFAEVEIGLRDKTIRVTTESIELEGIELGPFEIVLSYQQMFDQIEPYRVVACEPYLAHGDGCTHPHVQSERLCAGEGLLAIRAALEEGRLLDFFLLVRQVLRNYNPDSAYVQLDQWHGVNCRDCGCCVSGDDVSCCEPCGSDLCCDCAIGCECCGQYCCHSCSQECQGCGYVYCRECMKACADCDQSFCQSCLDNELKPGVCNDCLEEAEEAAETPQECPEAANPQPATTTSVHSLCVGQAELLARCRPD